MEMIRFIYNIILIVLFSVTLTVALTHYVQKKKPVYLGISIMFVFYILDNTIIYMTEFLESFANTYNRNFLSLPAFKTIVVLVYSACTLFILFTLQNRGITVIQYAVLIVMAVFLLFVPMLKQDALMVWLFYLPSQLFLFYISFSSLLYMKKHPNSLSPALYKKLKEFLLICAVFGVLILIEDTIVIFNYDIYSDLNVKINNRNVCDDILSILFSFYALVYMPKLDGYEMKTEQAAHMEAAPALSENAPALEPRESAPEENAIIQEGYEPEEQNGREEAGSQKDYTKNGYFYEFCNFYQLTSREREILEILLNDKNNQEICEACHISIGTVKTHVHNIFTKVDVAKRSQLIQMYRDFKIPS